MLTVKACTGAILLENRMNLLLLFVTSTVHIFKLVSSELTLTPSEVVPVCAGDTLQLTCNTSSAVHEWTFVDSNNGRTHQRTIAAPSSPGMSVTLTPWQINSLTISFSVVSYEVPNLISTLTIESTTSYLNASVINCTVGRESDMATIYVITSGDLRDLLQFSYEIMPLLEMGNVTVVLEFQSIDHQGSNNTLLVASSVSYNVSACSEAQVDNQERRRAQLTLPYNVLCDVIVEASLCGHSSSTTNIQLRYTNCEHPLKPNSTVNTSKTVVVSEYTPDWPVVEGTNLSLSCSNGLVLSGPNVSTCMENGQWVPDPSEVKCKVLCDPPTVNEDVTLDFNSTLEEAQLKFYCRRGLTPSNVNIAYCNMDNTWTPDPTGLTCSDPGNLPSPTDIFTQSETRTLHESAQRLPLIVGSSMGTLILLVLLLVLSTSLLVYFGKKGYRSNKEMAQNLGSGTQSESSLQNEQAKIADSEVDHCETLVYADIGQLCLKKPAVSLFDLEYHRTEYATIKHQDQSLKGNEQPMLHISAQVLDTECNNPDELSKDHQFEFENPDQPPPVPPKSLPSNLLGGSNAVMSPFQLSTEDSPPAVIPPRLVINHKSDMIKEVVEQTPPRPPKPKIL